MTGKGGRSGDEGPLGTPVLVLLLICVDMFLVVSQM